MSWIKFIIKIYVPIHEKKVGHRYLMVICIDEKKVYHLDSFTLGNVDKREDTIRDIVRALSYAFHIISIELCMYLYIDYIFDNMM